MKKAIIVLSLIAVLAVPAAFADWRVDIGVTPPIYAGLGSEAGAAFNYPLPFPTVSFSYQMGFGPLNLGVGIKAYTLILATAAWPQIFAEFDLDPIIIGLAAGGGLFGLFSPWGNIFESGNVFFPEVSVLFKLGRTFRLGVGGMSVIGIEEFDASFPYIVYGILKFTIPL